MNFKTVLSAVLLTAASFTSFGQQDDALIVLNPKFTYNNLGTLFSQDDNRGTARFNAMSGAFGALGGDISSITINPAGAAISKLSSISITGALSQLEHTTNYYQESDNSRDTNFRIPQIGGLLVFSNGKNSDWNKTALYFNYRTKTDFTQSYRIEGNSGQRPLYSNYNENQGIIYDNNIEQYITNNITGRSNVFDVGFSTVHKNKLYLGASLKFHQLDFSQESILNEISQDNNTNINDINTLDVEEYAYRDIYGNGFSFNLGFIYKFNKYLRIGLSYETPTFYNEVIEDFQENFSVYDNNFLDVDEFTSGSYFYQFQTPGKITASGAIIFGKKGLISLDYTHKNYKDIKYSDGDFSNINSDFANNLRNTYNLSIGTEWRFENLSIRGGASYNKNPNLTEGGSTNLDNIKGYSLGLGYNFGKTKFDLSFNNTENINYYSIYNTGDLSVDKNLTQISGTFTFSL